MKKNIIKIVLIWPYFSPSTGAAVARGVSFYDYLKKDLKYFVKVITPKRKTDHFIDDVYFLPLKLSFSPLIIITDFYKILKLVIKINPTHIIASLPPVSLGIQAVIVSILLNKRLIIDSRDLFVSAKKGRSAKLKQLFWKICFKYAHTILVTSKTQGLMAIRVYGANKKKVYLLPNGISNSLLQSATEKPVPKFDIVFLGTLVPERDFVGLEKYLDHFFKLRPKGSIGFIGVDLTNKETVGFVRKIKRKKYSNRLSFKQQLSQKSAFLHIKKFKLGLVSMLKSEDVLYQIPTKIYEYFAAELAIIALIPSNAAEIIELISTTKTGVFSSEPSILAQKTVDLLNNNNKLRKLQNNSKLAQKSYERQAFLPVLERLIATE